jgi:hypothetical protein
LTGRSLAWGLTLVALLAGRAAEAESFRCSRASGNQGPSLRWSERDLAWGLSPSLFDGISAGRDAVLDAARASFDAWQAESCSDLSFSFAGADARFEPGFTIGGENRNAVGLSEDWSFDPDTVALTITTFDTRTGVLLDADIELNGESFDFVVQDGRCDPDRGQMDLGNTLTHEAGHFIGLDHPPNTPSNRATTMFASAPACETSKRTLSAGDVEGLCTIYPRDGPTGVCYRADDLGFRVVERDDGFEGCRCARQPGPGGLVWIGGWGLLVISRRLIRKSRRTMMRA